MSLNVAFSSPNNQIFADGQKSQTEKKPPAAVLTALPGNSGVNKSPDRDSVSANLKKLSSAFNKRLQFIVDDETDQIMVKVIDANTDKVIKILPPEELRRLGNGIDENGLLLDTSA